MRFGVDSARGDVLMVEYVREGGADDDRKGG
jgi:hypothetical protein